MDQSETPAPEALKDMPDVANSLPALQTGLDWVGMDEIHQVIRVMDGDKTASVGAKVKLFVNLQDAHAKGIHMSRLYLLLNEMSASTALTPTSIKRLCDTLLHSHKGLSSAVLVQFEFEHSLYRKALVSDTGGWNAYPVQIKILSMGGKFSLELGTKVLYSSTCPCSAALARQLVQRSFDQRFADAGTLQATEVRAWLGTEEGIAAVPHSQRSMAHVLVRLEDTDEHSFHITKLVNLLEDALQTPVQTAVKREDEREFARLNGQNLMFCEDAARRLKAALSEEVDYADFWARVEHMESLHAHNVVAIATKGIAGGYHPNP